MLRSPTTFVIGAAVSNELGLPLGGALKQRIIQLFNDGVDEHVYLAATMDLNPSDIQRARNYLIGSLELSPSIDTTLSERPNDRPLIHLAKLCIARVIQEAERDSCLNQSWRAGRGGEMATLPDQLRLSTYARLFSILTNGVQDADLQQLLSRAVFIDFNYDRCLEACFYYCLTVARRMAPAVASRVLSCLRIEHPYGRLPLLQWEAGSEGLLPMNGVVDHHHLRAAAVDLRTFSEEVESERSTRLRQWITESTQVVFLGCAAHPQNLELLTPKVPGTWRRIYGTVYRIPEEDSHARPSFESYGAPDAEAFETSVRRWPRQGSIGWEAEMRFEPLSAKQMVDKYAPSWSAFDA